MKPRDGSAEREKPLLGLATRAAAGGADKLSATAGLGAAEQDGEHDTVEALLRRSDEALYAAKRAGRDRVVAWAR